MVVRQEDRAARDSCPDLRFFQSFEAATIGMGMCDLEGHILQANPALAHLLGSDPPNLVGTLLSVFQDAGIQDSHGSPHIQDLVAQLIRGERNSFTVETRFLRTNAHEFWGQLTISLARDAHGDAAFLVALLEDVTGRKQVEENLRQAEKMEVIGRLAGGIAHDFNNLLTGILLYCDLILTKLDPGNPLRSHAEGVQMAAEQGAALTQQLLAMARKQAPEPQALHVNEIVLSTENLLRRLIGEQIELLIALDDPEGIVFADPGQLRQVLLNLVVNARDALGSRGNITGGKIRLSTCIRGISSNGDACDSQERVALIVEDNGCGMNADTRAHLFEPFFTTKKPGEGTGVGLATVQNIVGEAGGHIEVVSEPGYGTRIAVIFPAARPIPSVSVTATSDPQLLKVPIAEGDSPC